MTPGVCFTRACGCSRLTSFPGLWVARMIRRGGTSVHSDERIDAFYKTRAWKRCRASYLASVGGLCERCLKRGLIVPADQVHHKIKITSDNLNDPAITLNHDNLEALCLDCHQDEHKNIRWRCDENGSVRIVR